ncbi:MAG: thioredoxin [Candidatus Omnitrophica bacterium CG11_big_fil_rev_8_21_14_0_20_63_9]|nr:MAG: thioredoxin [Candidatus Omnitrophica bacterium CG11_big_fil_rev_8_21_14_0_20_63_9]
MAGAAVEFTESNFEQEVLNASTPVLVDLWAAWCGPCRVIAPMVEELAGTYQGKVKIGKVNVDDHPQIAAQYRIMNIPTLLLFKGGQEVDRIVGVVPKEELSRRIERVLG